MVARRHCGPVGVGQIARRDGSPWSRAVGVDASIARRDGSPWSRAVGVDASIARRDGSPWSRAGRSRRVNGDLRGRDATSTIRRQKVKTGAAAGAASQPCSASDAFRQVPYVRHLTQTVRRLTMIEARRWWAAPGRGPVALGSRRPWCRRRERRRSGPHAQALVSKTVGAGVVSVGGLALTLRFWCRRPWCRRSGASAVWPSRSGSGVEDCGCRRRERRRSGPHAQVLVSKTVGDGGRERRRSGPHAQAPW